MKRKISSDYGFIRKNFENDSKHLLQFSVHIYRNLRDIEVGLICKLYTDVTLYNE